MVCKDNLLSYYWKLISDSLKAKIDKEIALVHEIQSLKREIASVKYEIIKIKQDLKDCFNPKRAFEQFIGAFI